MKRHFKKITLGLIGTLMITSNVYGSEVTTTSNSQENSITNEYEINGLNLNRKGLVTASVLNVRNSPSLNGNRISQFPAGQEVIILQQEGNWFYVTNGEIEGFVFGDYIEIQELEEDYLQATVKAQVLELRAIPSLEGQAILQFSEGQTLTILDQDEDWVLVSDGERQGYVNVSGLELPEEEIEEIIEEVIEEVVEETTVEALNKVAIVNVSVLNIRQEPNLSANVIGKTNRSNQWTITNIYDEWVEIETSNGVKGYLFKEYVTIRDKDAQVNAEDIRSELINYARQFLGNPYRYGGNSLTQGTDCSGFTQLIFRNFGYSISRTSRTQINDGVRISKSELLPGDLVFYGYNNSISHVAIYMGNDQIIHANTPSTGIVISKLNIGIPYIGATRIIK
jgi:cell wall-associated NlpC family hydrolase